MSNGREEAKAPKEYESPTRRVVLLGLAFVALVVVGVMTVLRPELEDAAGSEDARQPEIATPTPATSAEGAGPAPSADAP